MADPTPGGSGSGSGKKKKPDTPKVSTKYHGPSPIWSFFNMVKVDGVKKGQCKKCGKICSCAGGSTSGMRSHLSAYHTDDFNVVNAETLKAIQEKERQDLEADDIIGEYGLVGSSRKKEGPMSTDKWKIGDQHQQQGDMAVMKFIAANNLSFNLVDTPGFTEFMETVLPRFNLKHSSTYAK